MILESYSHRLKNLLPQSIVPASLMLYPRYFVVSPSLFLSHLSPFSYVDSSLKNKVTDVLLPLKSLFYVLFSFNFMFVVTIMRSYLYIMLMLPLWYMVSDLGDVTIYYVFNYIYIYICPSQM